MDAVIATRNEEEGEGAVAVVATCNVAVIRKLSSTQVPVMMNFLCAEPTPQLIQVVDLFFGYQSVHDFSNETANRPTEGDEDDTH
jgi:hypothetical protein